MIPRGCSGQAVVDADNSVMSDSGGNLLAKVMAVGVFGVLGSMGMLLYTLRVANPVGEEERGEILSQLAFETHLEQGGVIECSYGERGLRGVRRGVGPERIPFRVAGEIPSGLIERIIRRKVRLRSESVERGRADRPRGQKRR